MPSRPACDSSVVRLCLEVESGGLFLINDLLDYSRLERRSITRSQVDLPDLVNSILAERLDEIQSLGIKLSVDIQCQRVLAEKEGLSQAMRNLIDNAIKFCQDGTRLPYIDIGAQNQGTTCLLWVRDSGVGFDMHYHDRIFEIFQRLHRSEDYPGTGIGLALVRRVMERIGGRVWADSSPGRGASFYLEIPTSPRATGGLLSG